MLKADYEELKNGTKTLADLKSYFWNGKRDYYVLGLEESWSIEQIGNCNLRKVKGDNYGLYARSIRYII